MTTYQDIVRANGALGAWALVEPSGAAFAPYIGGTSLTASGITTYRDTAGPAGGFSVKVGIGGAVKLPFITTVNPPVTNECWFKLSTRTPAAYQLLFRAGKTANNGNGFWVDPSNSHIFYTLTAGTAADTGFLWPDLNWHLLTWSSSGGNVISLYFDGIIIWRTGVPAPNAPSPNVMGYTCDGDVDTSRSVVSIAYPAFYPLELAPSAAYATFLAASDPASALAYVTNAAGAGLQVVNATLTDITNLLYRDFPLP